MRGYSSVAGGGGRGRGEVLPIMAYTGKLHLKGVSFSGLRYSQTPLIPNTEGAIESVCIKWVEFRENVTLSFPTDKANCP